MQQLHMTNNGVAVYSYALPHLHSFCLSLYVKAGVLYEREGQIGITHFLEHMHFRNLGGMGQQELYERLEAMGAYFNASTYKEFLHFQLTATPRHFAACAELFTRLLAPLAVTDREVNLERRRIQSEIREDDYPYSLEYYAKREMWAGTVLRHPIAGTVTGIGAVGPEELARHKEESFQPQNLCFYLTGRVSEADVAALCACIERYRLPPVGASRRNLAPLPEGFGHRGGLVRAKRGEDLARVAVSFDVEYGRYTMAEVGLLYDVLFTGNLGRFYYRLSDKRGLVYDFDAYLDQYSNIGTLYLEFSVAQSKIDEAARHTAEVYGSMKDSVTEQDLSFHMSRYLDNYDLALDDADKLNWDMAYDNFILGRGLTDIEQIKGLYRAVTAERLMALAREIFRPDNLVVVIKAERGRCSEERVGGIFARLA